MTRLAALAAVGALLCSAAAPAGPEYPKLVRHWTAFPMPAPSARVEHALWRYAANYSPHTWVVSPGSVGVVATLAARDGTPAAHGLPFVPKVERYQRFEAAIRVSDGWLVGFNEGEFGAALYWFSETGRKNYFVSGDQVVAFVQQPTRLLAVEGLAHLSMSRGSVIELRQVKGRWRTSPVAALPFAPYAAVEEPDGQVLVVLSDALVRLTPQNRIVTVLGEAPWAMLYPTSAVLTADGKVLYVGMRQFVAEITLAGRSLRLLAPDKTFINVLRPEQEENIRRETGG